MTMENQIWEGHRAMDFDGLGLPTRWGGEFMNGGGVGYPIFKQALQDGAPKIAKLVYKWLNNGLW
jgi:hypothetical protein